MDTILIKEIIIGIIMGIGSFVCHTLRQKKYENEATNNNSNIGINVILAVSILAIVFIALLLAQKWGVQVLLPRTSSNFFPFGQKIGRLNWLIFLIGIITFLLCLFIKRKD